MKLLREIFHKNRQTTNIVIRTFPLGLFGLKLEDSIDRKKACSKVSEWNEA